MNHDIKNIIFEFTISLQKENEIVFGTSNNTENTLQSMEIIAYGFIVGITENFNTNQIIFYN